MGQSAESDDNSKCELAVVIKNVFKSYDKKGPRVLNNFSMNVSKGSIYGLLGCSGCGKTTALSCILGISKWESGEIQVFGEKPGSSTQESLAKRIGYVPQEIALYAHLSIKENIQYYGRLYGMPENAIFEQWLILANLLKLPSGYKLVNNLSGGQKRRASLALALVHQPELLVLDEPTVGLDPLLRESVWDHLFSLAKNKGTSIIITTHYIEETKKSDVIGVMRHGRLLVEESPSKLLAKHNTDLLEDVVLKLCWEATRRRSIKNNTTDSISVTSRSSTNSDGSDVQNNNDEKNSPATRKGSLSFQSNWKSDLTSVLVTDSSFSSQGTYSYTTFDSNDTALVTGARRVLKKRLSRGPQQVFKDTFGFFRRALATSLVIFLWLIRHPVFFFSALALPAYQVLLTFGCMGRNPINLNIAIINDEIPDWQKTCFPDLPTLSMDNNTDCTFTQLSCNYLQKLGSRNIIKLVPYNNTFEAINGVHRGDLWGFMHFATNYSQHTVDRFSAKQFATEESINGSTISVRLDMSEYLGSYMIIKHLYEQLQEYGSQLVNSCHVSASIVDIPLLFKKPVYGSEIDSYYDFYIPGIYTNILFIVTMNIAMLIFIADLKTGTFGRAQVAGRTIGEIVTAHTVSHLIILLGQVVICTLCVTFVYNFHVLGSLILYAVVALVIGICGQTIGILLAVIIQEEFGGLLVALFISIVIMISGGVLWPLAFTGSIWRQVVKISPTTMIVDSFRSVIARGVGITHELVWPGVAVTLGWIVALWIIIVISSKKFIK